MSTEYHILNKAPYGEIYANDINWHLIGSVPRMNELVLWGPWVFLLHGNEKI